MSNFEISVTPSPKLMRKIGATNLTVGESIAELVANSIDAGAKSIQIEVNHQKNFITVADDGAGITREVLPKALTLAENMAEYIVKPVGVKGLYGLGLKTACASLGNRWTLCTTADGMNQYFVEVNLANWDNVSTSAADAWKLIVSETPKNPNGPLGQEKTGTVISIFDLNDTESKLGEIINVLQYGFAGHIKTGTMITVNGTKCAVPDYNYLFSLDISEKFMVNGTQIVVSGTVGVCKNVSNAGDYGFNIYRNNQLLEAWNKDWFKAHLMTSRIKGDIDIDTGIVATFTKQGIMQDETWRHVKSHMEKALKPVVYASRELSQKGNVHNPAKVAEVIDRVQEEMKGTTVHRPINKPEGAAGGSCSDATGGIAQPKPKVTVNEKSLELASGLRVVIVTEVDYFQDDSFLVSKDVNQDSDNSDEANLQCLINANHPVYKAAVQNQSEASIRKVCELMCVYRAMVEDFKLTPTEAEVTSNKWLGMQKLGDGK
jgi:hypothetical protein